VHGVALEPHTLNCESAYSLRSLHPRWTSLAHYHTANRPHMLCLRAGIYANHQVDKRGNLTLAGFLSCVYEQTVENEAAIVWELQQLGYGSREAASVPGSGSTAPSAGVSSPAADGISSVSAMNVAAPDSEAEPAVVEPTAPAPAPATDTSATRSKTKSALLGGLRSGKLEDAVAKMEADEAAAAEAAEAEQLADSEKDDARGVTAESGDPAPAVLVAQAGDEGNRREEEEEEEEFVGSDDGKFGFDRGSDEDFEFD
jgi:hypothetical protein